MLYLTSYFPIEKKKLPDGFKSKNDATDFEQDAKMKRVLKFKRDIYKTYTTGRYNSN